MKEINTASFEKEIKDYKPRDCLKKIVEFIDGDSYLDGKILCLCGLEGMGKRTLMKQGLVACKFKNEECAFLEVEECDEINRLSSFFRKHSKKRGLKVVFIDEITKTSFADDADELSSMAAIYKLRIVVAGNSTNSFYLTSKNLYRKYKHMHDSDPWNETDWCEIIKCLNVADMTYAEYCRCFGNTSIGDFAEHGGLMDRNIAGDYKKAKRYVEECIAKEILTRPQCTFEGWDSCVSSFEPKKDACSAVEKICALLCGSVEPCKHWIRLDRNLEISVPSYEFFNDGSSMERKNILEPFARVLFVAFPDAKGVSANFVGDVLEIMEEEGFLSEVENTVFFKSTDGNRCQITEKEYHVNQNAVRYQYLIKDAARLWRNEWIGEKLVEAVKAEIIKKTVLFDAWNICGYGEYDFYKVSFMGRGFVSVGFDYESRTIDMVVYDRKQKRHWAFLVTFGKIEADKKILLDKEFTETVEEAYGARAGNYVIHSGENSVSEEGIVFINTEEFLLKLDELKDMEKIVNYFEEE